MTAASSLSPERIAEAAKVIDPVFLHSPQFVSGALSERLGLRLLCKVELLNPIRSFKGRGADYFLQRLGSQARPLVCASAGNFGPGLAYAAARRARAVTVFAARGANPLKLERMRQLGALVQLAGDDFDAAEDAARGTRGADRRALCRGRRRASHRRGCGVARRGAGRLARADRHGVRASRQRRARHRGWPLAEDTLAWYAGPGRLRRGRAGDV